MAMTLRPGEKFIRRWDHLGKFRCGQNPRNRNYLPYRLANGKLIYRPDLHEADFRKWILSEDNIKTTLEDGKPPLVHPQIAGDEAFISYRLKTAYPIVGGVVGGRFHRKTNHDSCKIYLSIADSDWTQVWSADETGELERYFARHEFSARWLLSSSDCEALSMQDLLEMADDDSRRLWESLKLGYTESAGHPRLRSAIAAL